MPAVYIGQDEHFLKTDLEVIITNRFIFESSPKEFITLQNASNRNEVCTIEKKDTWRKLFDFITLTDILQNQMGLVGEVIDCTTTYYLDIDYRARYEDDPTAMSRDRGLQITRWLKERKYNVSNYLVIDDSLDASYGHESNYHRTFGNRGFDLESYNECINKFDSLCMEK